MNILYVEDNPADVEFVRRALAASSRLTTLTVVGSLAQARALLGLDQA